MEGTGRYLVTAVGLNSQTGIIMKLLGATSNGKQEKSSMEELEEPDANSENDQEKKKQLSSKGRSVLQKKLGRLALKIGYFGLSFSGLTFVILCVRLAIQEFAIKKKPWSNIYIKYIISYLIQAITVVVVAVPEGLLLAVTLALAFAVRVSD